MQKISPIKYMQNICHKKYRQKNEGGGEEKRERGERGERGGGRGQKFTGTGMHYGRAKKEGFGEPGSKIRTQNFFIAWRWKMKWKKLSGEGSGRVKKSRVSYRATFLFCLQVGQTFVSLCCTSTGGYDHTNMTAPLPVCSAKLSMFGLG